MVMDLMHAYKLVNSVRMLLLLVSVIVYQWMPTTKKKDLVVLGDEPADGLNDTLITAEAKYFINITKFRKFVSVDTTVQSTVFCMLICEDLSVQSKRL